MFASQSQIIRVQISQYFSIIIDRVQMSLKNDSKSLFIKIQEVYLAGYKKQQKQYIYKLLHRWKNEDIANLMKDQSIVTAKDHILYKQNAILSARVYDKVLCSLNSKNSKIANQQPIQDLCSIIRQQNLQLSYNRYFWRKRPALNKYFFEVFSQSNPKLGQHQIHGGEANIILQKLGQKQNSCAIKLINFLIDIQLISKKYYPNYFYYSSNSNNSINLLHSKYKDYEFLEESHDYIQLMFPNHYFSSFNSDASPLSYLESQLFSNLKIGFRMFKSIYLFLDFLGIRINIKTFQLKLISKKRFVDALIVNIHNHLRIMRILACLSVTGFRKIGINLIHFLDQQLLQIQKIEPTLRETFKEKWEIYDGQKQEAKVMFFLQSDAFPKDHEILSVLKSFQIKKATKH